MQKIIDFGISESSTMERLNSGHDLLDLENGTGEYLGTIKLGSHEIVVTRTISSGKGRNNGKIMANEVEYDTYSDGSIAVYYNTEKTDELQKLQQQLNHPLIEKMLAKGKSIKEALREFGVNIDKYGTFMEEKIESEFRPGELSIFPEDYDYGLAMKGNVSQESKIKKVPVERLIATGIKPELFESLRDAKKYTHMSAYQMAVLLRKMQENKENKRTY